MGKGSAPTPPNPKETAGAQTSTNIGTAIASNHMQMMNQHTPWGSLTFGQVGGSSGGGGGSRSRAPRPAPKRPDILDQSFAGWMSEKNRGYPQGGSWDPGSDRQQNLRVEFENRRDLAREKYLKKKDKWDDRGGPTREMRGGGGGGGGTYYWDDPTTGKTYAIPQYESTMTLDPTLQKGLDFQFEAGKNLSRQIARNARERIKTPNLREEFGDAGEITRTYGDPEGYAEQRQRVEDALMERMDPYIQQDRSTLDTQLANKGIMAGSTAFDRENDRFSRGVNDARLGAILNAGQEQNRLAELDRSRAAFENTAQQQQYGQLRDRASFFNNAELAQFNANQQARAMPINQLGALLNAGQVSAPPVQMIQPQGFDPVDYAGMVYKNADLEMQAYQQQQANSRAMMGGLFGLAGKMIG